LFLINAGVLLFEFNVTGTSFIAPLTHLADYRAKTTARVARGKARRAPGNGWFRFDGALKTATMNYKFEPDGAQFTWNKSGADFSLSSRFCD
jgi:hypothetical protein